MKKLVGFLFLALVMSSFGVFAQSAKTAQAEYEVQTVTGKVEREVSAGKWEAVKPGMKLAPSAVVNTSLNSTLVLKLADKVVTIKAMQKGTIDKLVSGVASTGSGIKLGSTVTKSAVTAEAGQARTNISTASTRASEAKDEIQWVSEE